MAEQWIPSSTTLSDVLAAHRRRLDQLTRENQALWTVIRTIEDQQSKERAHRRTCDPTGQLDGQLSVDDFLL